MSILSATILATESARLRDAATAQLLPNNKTARLLPNNKDDEAVRATIAEDLSAALDALRAMIAETARRHADQLSPNELIELQTALHAALDQQLARAFDRVLEQRTRALAEAARRDPLTGLLNRAALDRHLQDEVARARRYGRALALVLFDVDRFKLINDRCGHPAGDEALRYIARALRASLRQSDAVFRYGGDEFAAICPETSGAVMSGVLLRLENEWRSGAADQPYELRGVSWGLAAWPADASEAADLLRVADARLYVCKQEHHRRGALHTRSFSR